MRLLTASVKNWFEVTYDSPALFVGLQVYEIVSGAPVVSGSVIPMLNVAGSNTYVGGFIPVAGKEYIMVKRVYADGSYTTPDDNYGIGSEAGPCSAAATFVAGVNNAFEVTFDSPSLFVGMVVYDLTGGVPVAVTSPIPMINAPGSNTYGAEFPPLSQHSYLFLKRVYTDASYSVLDSNYAASSESGYAAVSVDIAAELELILKTLYEAKFMGVLTGWLYLEGNLPPQWPAVKPAQIIQGSHATVIVRLMNATTMDPVDITGATEIKACFTNQDWTQLELSLTGGQIQVLSGILGKVQLNLTAAQTALLAMVENETLELLIKIGMNDPVKVQIQNAYSILETIC